MADYYPLLARAVSGLKDSDPKARAAIYERARKALLGQLRNMDPPAPEAAIEREAQALDAAIAKLELEHALAPAEAEPQAEDEARPEPAAVAAEAVAEPTPEPQLAAEPQGAVELRGAVEPAAEPAAEIAAAEVAPAAELTPSEAKSAEPEAVETTAKTLETAPSEPAKLDERENDAGRENLRPAAPKPRVTGRAGLRRFGIMFGALTAVVLVVGFAAWKLRDRPEDLARLAPPPASANGDERGDGKIAARVGDAAPAASANEPASRPTPVQTVPIAYRAAVLIQAPGEPGGVKTYIGSVVWRRESVNRGPDNQLAAAIRADVVAPEAGFNASLTIEKNYDASLSASHTISIHFNPAPDSPIGPVKTINVPEMRRDDAPRGAPLQGMQVDVAPNVFIVGLYASAETQNLDMLRNLAWIDIPMSLTNGKIAKLTFEKGAIGTQIINDVLTEWQSAGPK